MTCVPDGSMTNLYQNLKLSTMKSYLKSFALASALALSLFASSQCSVTNPTISNLTRVSDGLGNCSLKFDLDFTMANNNGNKTIALHLWPGASYPNLPYSKATPAADLATAYGTVVIDNNSGNPVFYSVYPFASGVTMLTTDATIRRTGGSSSSVPFQFHISGITIPNISCSDIFSIKGDMWSTNAGSLNANTMVQCNTKNISFLIGDPTLSAPLKDCSSNRSISFGITTESLTPINVTYSIYRDDKVMVGGKPVFDPSTDVEVTIGGEQPVTLSKTTPFNTSTFCTGSATPGENSNYWVIVSYIPETGTEFSYGQITNSTCGILPVTFSSFTATRMKEGVAVKWQTTTEQNNRGFNIQRRSGTEEWKNIAFIFSQTADGYSSNKLDYSYTDRTPVNGIVQYRIQQVDMDYKSSYSEIRSVKDELIKNTVTVYPNPTHDGTINVMMEDQNASRNIMVSDMMGRVIRTFNNVTGNTLQITNLADGFYTLRIFNETTATTTVEKIVVTKR
jgi:hypothetical protein